MTAEFDPTKAKANLRKDGVSSLAERALQDPMALTMDDPDSRGAQRFATLGTDALGRVPVDIHTQREERTRLISARKAGHGEADRHHA